MQQGATGLTGEEILSSDSNATKQPRYLLFTYLLMVLLKGFAIIVKRGKRRWVEMQRQYEKYQEQGTGFTATDIFGSKVQGSGFKG